MSKKSAIKTSLFAAEEREQKFDRKGDLLSTLNQHVNFVARKSTVGTSGNTGGLDTCAMSPKGYGSKLDEETR